MYSRQNSIYSSNSDVFISLEKVNKYFGKQCILKNVTLSLYDNSITAVIGNNGAGKSSIANIISGLWECNNGILNLKNIQPGNISYLLQSTFIDGHLSVKNNLDIIAAMKSKNEKTFATGIIQKLNEIFSVSLNLKKPVKKLSGGQKRMLEFCVAIDPESRLIILDEATAGLDFSAKLNAINWLRQVQIKNKNIILLCTHDPEEFKLAERFLMVSGKTIASHGVISNRSYSEIYNQYNTGENEF